MGIGIFVGRNSGPASPGWSIAAALLCLSMAFLPLPVSGEGQPGQPARVVREVSAEGACAISGMSAEQSQLIAVQKARSGAIEQAAGVKVVSSSLVRDGAVAVDLIRTYARGFIVREKVEWLPLAQYQESPDKPPIPEYRVRITADVAVPERKERSSGLSARLNNKVFRKGETAWIEIRAERDARFAVFNVTADDKVVLVFPHSHDRGNLVSGGTAVRIPGPGSRLEFVMQTLPGHSSDAEAFLVVAFDKDSPSGFPEAFEPGAPLPLASFFERYAKFAVHADEILLPYVVEANE
jgi:hypothetical protein